MEPSNRRKDVVDTSRLSTLEESSAGASDELDTATLTVAHSVVDRSPIENSADVITAALTETMTEASDRTRARIADEPSWNPASGDTRSLWGDGSPPAKQAPLAIDEVPQHPQRIDRYVILSRVGAGGMGVVYQAYDPQLDRRVAIKLLLDRKTRRKARLRLWREAQALAQLSDPNVVSVFDIGVWEGRVFVAMEFVEGQNMDDWLKAQPRTRKQVLDVFVAAGRGLAAAHAAGLVHRDFKPANVIVGDDGRVRVLDFGLARASERDDDDSLTGGDSRDDSGDQLGDQPGDDTDGDDTDGERGRPEPNAGLLDNPVTEHGAIIGTPAYMSPEQLEGHIELSASTDQYSFCVALYEAMYGQRPFSGASFVELREQVLSGELAETPTESEYKVPPWLRKALVRGLARAPEDRFPSIESLLAELTHDRWAIWRKLTIAAIVTVAVIAVLIATLGGPTPEDRRAACRDNASYLAGVWDDATRNRIQARFAAVGGSAASVAYHRVRLGLDQYAESWAQQRTAACMATHVHRSQSSTLLDRRMNCLERRLTRMDELIAVLDSELTAENLPELVTATYGLPDLEACRDEDALLAAYPLPETPERAAEVATQNRRIDRASALGEAGNYQRAVAIAREVVDAAAPLDYPPLAARAHLELGKMLAASGHWHDADEAYRAAIQHGARAHDDALLARVWTARAWLLGYYLGQPQRGLDATEVAEMLVARADNDPVLSSSVIGYRGVLLAITGDMDGAIEHFKREVAVREMVFAPDHPQLARGLGNLGKALMEQGRYDEAFPFTERALAIRAASVGPTHQDVAPSYLTLGQLRQSRAEYDQALQLYQRAHDINVATFGEQHMKLSYGLSLIGGLWYERGDYKQARAHFERAIAMLEEQAGPEHHYLLNALDPLGQTVRAHGQMAEARTHHERARTIIDKHSKLPPVEIARNRRALGDLARELGDLDQALTYHREAVELLRTAGQQGFDRARAHESLAMTLVATGELKPARSALDEALAALTDSVAPSHPYVALLTARRADIDPAAQPSPAVYQQALSRVRDALGENHPWMAEVQQMNERWRRRSR